jgi:peptidyl-prolyl cis-trans isomerase B (cyclophilin B)
VPQSTNKRERQRINREARRAAIAAAEKRRKQRRTARNLGLLLIPFAIVLVIVAVSSGGGSNSTAIKRNYSKAPAQTIDPTATYTAQFQTSLGNFEVLLDAKDSPVAVNNFVFLASHNFYNGLLVNRVAKDFVIQAGSPNNTQAGGPGYSVAGEVPTTVAGQPAYPVGAVAMAKTGSDKAGTSGSQFFIVTGSGNTGLTADYAYLGSVTSGIDVVQKIGQLYPKSGSNDGPPTKKVTIKHITIVGGPSTTTATSATTTTVAPTSSTG